MAVGTTNFGELLWPGIRDIYGLDYAQFPEEYSKLFETITSKKAYEESLGIAGFGMVPIKPQGAGVSYADPAQGFKHRLTPDTYGLGFSITREMYDDDQYSQMKEFPAALSFSVKSTIETVAALIYDRAFSGSYVGADGLELCSTAHLLKLGGTYANEPTTPSALAEESFRQALVDISDFTTDSGLPINAKGIRLVVHPDNDFRASKLLESSKEPETANNAKNPAMGRMPYFVSNYITNTKYWYIRTDVRTSLQFVWRRKPEFTRDNDFDSENAKYKTTFRMVCGWHDPRGIYGNPKT